MIKTRKQFARQYERDLVGAGFDVRISTSGARHETLIIKWSLGAFSSLIQRLVEELTTSLPSLGFRTLTVTDPKGYRWTVTLTAKS